MGLGITRRGQVRWWALLVPQHWPRFHSPFVVLGLYPMKCTSLLVPVNDQVSIVLEPPHGVHDQPRRATNVLQSRTVEFCAIEPADKRTIPEHGTRKGGTAF